MEHTFLKDIFIILLVIVVAVLYYKDNKKRTFVKNCPKCNSNDLDRDMIFLRKEKRYIPKAKDPRTLTDNLWIDARNQEYFEVTENIYNVKYKCNNCGYEFSREIIK